MARKDPYDPEEGIIDLFDIVDDPEASPEPEPRGALHDDGGQALPGQPEAADPETPPGEESERVVSRYPFENSDDFLEEIEKTPDALLVGARNLRSDNMPGKNTFANKFSNFWFRVETGMRLDDTQSGFRLYPVRRMEGMRFLTRRYEFEVEVLVRAAWRGIAVRNIPVNVFYPEKDERVTHFRPGKDFTRISILNTFLVLGALLFYYPWRFLRSLTKENIRRFVADNITRSRDSNPQLAASIGLGIFFGIAPLWGYQMIAAGVTAHFTRLNKAVAILSSNISIPPMIPFILYGSYWTGAQVLRRAMPLSLSDITLERAAADMFQYVVGSFVMAAVCAVAAAAVSYALLVFCKRTPRHE